jgi:transposase
MLISSNYNRWYRANIVEDIKRNLDFPIVWAGGQIRLNSLSRNSIHEMLKYLNLSYPKDNDGVPISFTQINNKQLTEHIEEIRKLMAENGYTFYFDEVEWARLCLQARGVMK